MTLITLRQRRAEENPKITKLRGTITAYLPTIYRRVAVTVNRDNVMKNA